MEDIVMNTSNITNYKPKDFAELLGVSVKTLQRWDREGILKANRTPTNRRYYTYDQYLQFKGINTENDNRQIVIYARVSTRNQKEDLQNKVTIIPPFCKPKAIIIKKCIYKKKGDKVEYFDNASKALGIIFFKFDSAGSMNRILQNIDNHIRILLK